MKNFIFISPNFPANYWKFCRALKDDGFRVLGIGDCPYDELDPNLRKSMHEYYKVDSLENYGEVYRAVAFFAFKYGRIDFLESNNEYWLERDAMLRTDFNIKSGFLQEDIGKIKYKSQMKKYYLEAGVKVAKYCIVGDLENCREFIKEVGYPVIVKPDNGVGAAATYKLHDEKELADFIKSDRKAVYIMEEFIDAEVNSYDAIVDGDGNPVFETGNVTPESLMDVVNNGGNCAYYILNNSFDDVRELGRRTVKAFGVKNRFVHFEFFRLLSDQRIGKKGEVVALEVNMRPAGGISPDMMNYANSVDVYKIWADTLAGRTDGAVCGEKYYCGFAGRRYGKEFYYTEREITAKYGDSIKIIEDVPEALSNTMGNRMFIAAFKTKEELDGFYSYVFKTI